MYMTADYSFAQLYSSAIVPLLRRATDERASVRPRSRTWAIAIGVLSGAMTLAALIMFTKDLSSFLILLGFGSFSTLILCGVIMREPHRPIDARLAEHTGEILAEHTFNGSYLQEAPKDWVPVDRLAELGVIGWSGTCQMGAGLEGIHSGRRFRIAFVHKTRKMAGDKDHNDRMIVFSGLVLKVDLPVSMPLTVIRPRNLNSEYARVQTHVSHITQRPLGDSEFDQQYELWTRSGQITREALGPDFSARFLTFTQSFGRKISGVGLIFDGNTLLVAIDRRRQSFLDLEAYGLDETSFQEKCAGVVEEMRLPGRMIDTLLGA